MARILIGEPDDDVRTWLIRVLSRLGHDPVPSRGGDHDDAHRIDAALIEAASAECFALARTLRTQRVDLPIVFFSTKPADAATEELKPASHLVKPATGELLRAAIEAAVRGSPEA